MGEGRGKMKEVGDNPPRDAETLGADANANVLDGAFGTEKERGQNHRRRPLLPGTTNRSFL